LFDVPLLLKQLQYPLTSVSAKIYSSRKKIDLLRQLQDAVGDGLPDLHFYQYDRKVIERVWSCQRSGRESFCV
jgi:hypothetical protein